MYRIRFHGRGGQGMKTASRVLGRAFFLSGFEVQDAPRYGAERRGAPIFSYVRADRKAINERGIIRQPDLVIIADDTLVALPAAACLNGVRKNTVVLLYSDIDKEVWQQRLQIPAQLLVFSQKESSLERAQMLYIGTACVGAAAALLGMISAETLAAAIRTELASLKPAVIEENIRRAQAAFAAMAAMTTLHVEEGSAISASEFQQPDWIDLPLEPADISAPVIHGALTSERSPTGLWRTIRPVIDYEKCNHCWWVCSSFCPDSAIVVKDNIPEIDYDHCKGCLICVSQCPPKAIHMEQEKSAAEASA